MSGSLLQCHESDYCVNLLSYFARWRRKWKAFKRNWESPNRSSLVALNRYDKDDDAFGKRAGMMKCAKIACRHVQWPNQMEMRGDTPQSGIQLFLPVKNTAKVIATTAVGYFKTTFYCTMFGKLLYNYTNDFLLKCTKKRLAIFRMTLSSRFRRCDRTICRRQWLSVAGEGTEYRNLIFSPPHPPH